MNLPNVKLENGLHNKSNVIFIRFRYNDEIIRLIKQGTPARWNAAERAWMLPCSRQMTELIKKILEGRAFVEEIDLIFHETGASRRVLPDSTLIQIERMRHWMQARRMSDRTIEVYINVIRVFLSFFSEKPPSEITNDDITKFNIDYIISKGLSSSYQNQAVNAIKLFYKITEDKKIDPEIIYRPKNGKVDPRVLSKEDIKSMLDLTANLKHKTMLSLIYACGLRRGELLALVKDHIDFNRKVLYVRSGKGNKDRMVPIGERMLALLNEYLSAYRPKAWLFEGQESGTTYGERSLQQVMKQAAARAGISGEATLHWLRHSYATHLHEDGTDIRFIQELLGHKSSKTTEIYTHVSRRSIEQIRSPFDSL